MTTDSLQNNWALRIQWLSDELSGYGVDNDADCGFAVYRSDGVVVGWRKSYVDALQLAQDDSRKRRG